MNDEILKQIEVLESKNNIESYNKIIEIIDKQLDEDLSKDEKKLLENKKLLTNINILKLKLTELKDEDYKEEINLRGKLISLYRKAARKADKEEDKMAMRHNELEELKKHKEVIKKYRTDGKTTISLPKKVGLNILEISKSIEIFMKEKDVLTKLKNIAKETIVGTSSAALLIGGTTLAIQYYLGIPLTLSSLVSALPVVAYIGLSSIIRNFSSKTKFEQYEYHQSLEYKALIDAFNEKNKEAIEEIAKIVKEKTSITKLEDKITINEELIKKLDELANSTDIQGIKNTFQLQALSCLRESKECCEEIKDDYLEERNDNKEKYNLYKQKLRKINFEIFKRGNSFEEAVKSAGKNVVTNAKVLLIAKAILACAFPTTFPINGAASILEPFAFAVINGIIDIPTYHNKLKFKETEYEGKVKVKNKERIEQIIGPQQPKLTPA